MMEGRNEVEAVSIGYMKHTQFTIHIIAPKREFFLNIQRLSPLVVLLWRFAQNSHPLFMNIAWRGIELDTRCAVCHKYFEDGGHLFLSCKFAK
jgi:hypothetical protein